MAQEVTKSEFKVFDASSWCVGIVVAEFNRDITKKLLESALEKAREYKVSEESISVVHVAGSVEIPVFLKGFAEKGRVDALVALGCVIRGETPHFDYVAKIASEGVLRVMMDYGVSVGFGVLTCETKGQAFARTHVGGEAFEAAVQSAKALRELS